MIKNVNLSTKPQVSICLPEILEAFCRLIFISSDKKKEIIIRRNHPVGKLIYSKIQFSYVPVKQVFLDRKVTFILPITNVNQHACRKHYIYFDNVTAEQLVDGIEYEFKKWIHQRFESGYELGFDQKTIIEAILRGLNLRNSTANFDTIKKNDYRNRRKAEEKRFKMLLNNCTTIS